MLMTPEKYNENLKNRTLSEMIRTRDELINDIRDYEDAIGKGYDIVMTPDPLTVYKNNCMCLIEVCRLIHENVDDCGLNLA